VRFAPNRLIVAVVLLCCSASWAGPRETGKLRLLDHIAPDPLIVFAAGNTNLAEVYDGWVEMVNRFGVEDIRPAAEKNLAELDQKLGCSVMQDLLARVGPEYAFVVDLPPIDQLMGSMAMGPGGVGDTLKNLGVLAVIDGPQAIDGCLRKLLEHAEARITDEDGLVRIEMDAGSPESTFSIYYGMEGDLFAMGPSPDFVRASLKPRSKGARLTDGVDFAKVFKHLDFTAEALTYVNLPRARELVEDSAFVQAALAAEPESSVVVAAMMEPEFSGIGFGGTSVRTDEGTLTTSFGPSSLSGGVGGASSGIIAAIAVPNLLNAIDRGKQKRSMADIRTAATCIEEYSIDNNVYPGPTDGWVPLEQFSDLLSPTYIRELPSVDGWGHTLLVWSDGENYRIVSPGKDGELERDWSGDSTIGGPTSHFTSDIVFENGSFRAWPKGTQQ